MIVTTTVKKFIRISIWIAVTILVVICDRLAVVGVAAAFDLVIVGPGAQEVKLIAGKLAVKSGDRCSIITPPDEKFIQKSRTLMYGKDRDAESDAAPAFVSTGEEIGDALETAKGIIITCEKEAMEEKLLTTLLDNAPKVQHICLLSMMGGRLRTAEDLLKTKCSAADIQLSIIRAGTLKGGGPGNVEGSEFGLNKYFDATIFDLLEARNSMSFDKFTLGARVTAGDPFQAAASLFSSSSFEPSDTTTSRTVAAQALLIAIKRDTGIDISLSSEKGNTPPTPEEWSDLLSSL